MKMMLFVVALLLVAKTTYCQQQYNRPAGLRGNTMSYFILDSGFSDQPSDFPHHADIVYPVDDTVNYKRVMDDIYQDTAGLVFKINYEFAHSSNNFYGDKSLEEIRDTTIWFQFYYNVTKYIDLKSYKWITHYIFLSRDTLYYWNYSGAELLFAWPLEDADPMSFIPFEHDLGGRDRSHVYFGRNGIYAIIKDADPKTCKLFEVGQGYRISGKCYMTDRRHVYYFENGFYNSYGSQPRGLDNDILDGADPKTFRLVNQEKVHAEDKHRKYFEGRVLGAKPPAPKYYGDD